MQAIKSLDLDTFNWKPGVYAHASWWQALSDVTPPAMQSSSWFIARLSRFLITEHRLEQRYLRTLPAEDWLLWDADAVYTLAFELGIAMHARHYCAALDRRTVLSFIALLGVSGRERALHYRAHYSLLATWGDAILEPPMTRRELVDAGGFLLCEIARRRFDSPVDQACAMRFSMRFSRLDQDDEQVDESLLADANRLVAQVCTLIQPSGAVA